MHRDAAPVDAHDRRGELAARTGEQRHALARTKPQRIRGVVRGCGGQRELAAGGELGGGFLDEQPGCAHWSTFALRAAVQFAPWGGPAVLV